MLLLYPLGLTAVLGLSYNTGGWALLIVVSAAISLVFSALS
jgi:hypothetical protein